MASGTINDRIALQREYSGGVSQSKTLNTDFLLSNGVTYLAIVNLGLNALSANLEAWLLYKVGSNLSAFPLNDSNSGVAFSLDTNLKLVLTNTLSLYPYLKLYKVN